MGNDYWSYGFEANRHVLETFTRYHYDQSLSVRNVAPEELFARSTLDLTRIQQEFAQNENETCGRVFLFVQHTSGRTKRRR